MSEVCQLDCLVIGAGVVGIAVARELALAGKDVWLVEREASFGMGTSSRNSEVIHAGIYYPDNSLKASLCVQGKDLLYDYCEENSVPFLKCGKLIVAQSEQQNGVLEQINHQAVRNGVTDLRWLDRHESAKLAKGIRCQAALFSPSTGIVDSHALMQQLLNDFERAGGQYVPTSELVLLDLTKDGLLFSIKGEAARVKARYCINSAGLSAKQVLEGSKAFPQDKLPSMRFAKGHYFAYQGRTDFKHLIYPVPEDGGLGVHLTLDLQGMAKFGPDVQWLEADTHERNLDFSVDPALHAKFLEAIRQYWPGIDADCLVPDYAGVRPKLSAPGEPAQDFMIQSPEQHGVPGLLNLFGIESPGLTASLALAKHVREMLHL